jgi:hypothetical protein
MENRTSRSRNIIYRPLRLAIRESSKFALHTQTRAVTEKISEWSMGYTSIFLPIANIHTKMHTKEVRPQQKYRLLRTQRISHHETRESKELENWTTLVAR